MISFLMVAYLMVSNRVAWINFDGQVLDRLKLALISNDDWGDEQKSGSAH
jgi:hypothetical protein